MTLIAHTKWIPIHGHILNKRRPETHFDVVPSRLIREVKEAAYTRALVLQEGVAVMWDYEAKVLLLVGHGDGFGKKCVLVHSVTHHGAQMWMAAKERKAKQEVKQHKEIQNESEAKV